jgi:hypothetical protein
MAETKMTHLEVGQAYPLPIVFGSDRGGQTAAILRSFTASCQRAGVEPFAWFKDVLSRIATHPINVNGR